MERRIITTDVMEEDLRTEGNLRPQYLEDYIGQEKAKGNLENLHRSSKATWRCPGSCTVLWTSGTWKNHSGRNYCQ